MEKILNDKRFLGLSNEWSMVNDEPWVARWRTSKSSVNNFTGRTAFQALNNLIDTVPTLTPTN